jgi:uncharacterized MAPEG superfamily protein
MPILAAYPGFMAYAVAMLVLALNLLVLWSYSAVVRGKTKTTPNAEDARGGGTTLVEGEPPEVARVLRAHTNAMANIVPFAILGLVFVLAGGSAIAAEILFFVFVAARVVHSLVYLAGKQPWRTMMFIVGALDTLVLMAFVVRTLLDVA